MLFHMTENLLRNLRPKFSLQVLQTIFLMYADAVELYQVVGNFFPVLQLQRFVFLVIYS